MAFFMVSSAEAKASGTFVATGTTTNATSKTCDPQFRPNNDPGVPTVSTVKVNGNVVPATDYEILNPGTSDVKVYFYTALPNGAAVEIRGTTTNSGEHPGSINFS